jgi:hypothetical protein
MEKETALRLRRINRIRTIHGSLAIEGNTLSKDRAIQDSTAQTDSAPFIEFMLGMMRDAIAASTPQVAPRPTPQVTPQVMRLLQVSRGQMSRDQLQAALGLKDRKSFRDRYLRPALDAGLIAMTLPDKPNSRLQQYRLTVVGRAALLAGGTE